MPPEPRRRLLPQLALLFCGVVLADCGIPPATATTVDAAVEQTPAPPDAKSALPAAEAAPASGAAPASSGAPSPMPSPMPSPLPAPPATPVAPAGKESDPILTLLVFAERVRGLSAAERAREIGAVGAEAAKASPERQLQLALLLSQNRAAPGELARAQQLAQQVADSPQSDALPLKPLARLLAVRLAEQRRLEEQLDKTNQQLRDQQRRIDQLNQRLEAVRAIERSMTPRPAPSAVPLPPAPGAAPHPEQRAP